jgi:hypothetical protein
MPWESSHGGKAAEAEVLWMLVAEVVPLLPTSSGERICDPFLLNTREKSIRTPLTTVPEQQRV